MAIEAAAVPTLVLQFLRSERPGRATHEILDAVQRGHPDVSEMDVMTALMELAEQGALRTTSDHGTVHFFLVAGAR